MDLSTVGRSSKPEPKGVQEEANTKVRIKQTKCATKRSHESEWILTLKHDKLCQFMLRSNKFINRKKMGAWKTEAKLVKQDTKMPSYITQDFLCISGPNNIGFFWKRCPLVEVVPIFQVTEDVLALFS